MEKDFRLLLQETLVKRCQTNPRYSLRSFARSLNIASSALSAILNGKRPITQRMKIRLGSALGLSATQIENYDEKSKNVYPQQFHQLALDTFAVISDWYHYSILELTYVRGFESSSEYISKKLGVTKSEINFAVERLKRIGFLKEIDGKWVDSSPNSGFITNIDDQKTSLASRKMQKQILEKSIEALETVSIGKRSHTSMTMAVNIKDLPKARELIKKFRRTMNSEMDSASVKTNVYQLHVGFFPVEKDEKESK